MPLPARYIDAGLATDTSRRVAVFQVDEWAGASEEELALLRDLPLHENQEYMLERDLVSDAVRVVWRYQVPVITSLRS